MPLQEEFAVPLRDELIAAMHDWDPALHDLDDNASLIRSGLLDSTSLLNLALWIEAKIGAPLDPTTFDVAGEWDTIPRVLAFVESRQSWPQSDTTIVPPRRHREIS